LLSQTLLGVKPPGAAPGVAGPRLMGVKLKAMPAKQERDSSSSTKAAAAAAVHRHHLKHDKYNNSRWKDHRSPDSAALCSHALETHPCM
jgi:hypothetical protein